MDAEYGVDRARTPGPDEMQPDRLCAALVARRSDVANPVQGLGVELDQQGENELAAAIAATRQRLREIELASRQRMAQGDSAAIPLRVAIGIGLRRAR